MAIDEAILAAHEQGLAPATLRFYAWNPAGISLGFGQPLAAVSGPCPEIPRVRRMTGGEAIFHDQELTYSLVMRAGTLDLPRSIRQSYMSLGRFIQAAFSGVGVEAEFFGAETTVESDFCFARPRRFDMCVGGKKLGGHAQRRRAGILFQHGSIPLALDYARIARIFGIAERDLRQRMISLNEAAGRPVAPVELEARLTAAFGEVFAVTAVPGELTGFEVRLSAELVRRKYATRRWNEQRRAEDDHSRERSEPELNVSPAGLAV
jgi:lipoate-protein ligase A